MMKILLKPWYVVITLLVLTACAPQRTFYFSPFKSSSGPVVQDWVQPDPLTTHTPAADLPGAEASADTLVAAAATYDAHTPFAAPVKALSAREEANWQSRPGDRSLGDGQVKPARVWKAAGKKGTTKAASERSVHPLAWVGFGLSMAGVVLLITALAVTVPVLPFALSFISFIAALITSRNAISRIKKNSEQFSGKGLAKAGFALSLVMLLIAVAFILYILAFAGASQ